jgi:hypothetical protein
MTIYQPPVPEHSQPWLTDTTVSCYSMGSNWAWLLASPECLLVVPSAAAVCTGLLRAAKRLYEAACTQLGCLALLLALLLQRLIVFTHCLWIPKAPGFAWGAHSCLVFCFKLPMIKCFRHYLPCAGMHMRCCAYACMHACAASAQPV